MDVITLNHPMHNGRGWDCCALLKFIEKAKSDLAVARELADMFWLVVSVIVALLVGYCTYTIFFDLDQEVATDLSDYLHDTGTELASEYFTYWRVIS